MIAAIGNQFLGTPYVGKTLELPGEEQLVINLMEVDCTTFVETVLALTITIKQGASDFQKVAATLEQMRYLNGSNTGYGSRLHYFSDWIFENEKAGQFPDTKWKINKLGKGWVLGETLITGIGQGYTQTTPIQLCLMTAQIANGGYKITPKILTDDNQLSSEQVKKAVQDSNLNNFNKPLYDDQKNIRIVQEAMFSSTNELRGTSYKSRIDDPKYQFAGKTGTAQVKRISKRERELDLKTFQIPYEERDHALYVAFGPYIHPRYEVSIIVEHGGSGSAAAAPMATKLFKLIVDRHQYRKKLPDYKEFNI